MARVTRSKPKPKEATPEPPVSTVKPLPSSASNPPKLFVLPKDASPDARIVTLENPANGAPSRYFFCPQEGFYEFTRIVAPKKECRSWLITGEESEEQEQEENRIGAGYITKSADLFVATPIDLLFLLLPALAPKTAKDTKQHFLALDDYLDKLYASSRHWRPLTSQHSSLKTTIEKKLRATCDTVDAGDETMYRLSNDKLLAILIKKAERMVKHGLPPSLEERFIKTALEVPVMNIKREDSSLSTISISEESTENDSQVSTTTTAESQTSISTAITTPDTSTDSSPKSALSTPPQIPHLLRLRTSLSYLSTSYLPPSLHAPVTTHAHTSPTFTPLATHLSALASLRTEAAALRSISDNMSRKRAIEEDDDRVFEREEKKRKKEEEEKKKKSEGRAVKQLKKVDTSGMKKMSSFFVKVAKKT
ncbi:hypothetical protein CC86DRAFT_368852 [Ophiobolus disseminans]|uniref:Ribonuclease H2 subunit B n=1 Tax=Ophiobolus disseminans TaxID=1469910 RepID=A0A6A7A5W6_9PLEO|nr:hypothetical protein CC86DRAFT_368852 [Ophiobolus disseminans]